MDILIFQIALASSAVVFLAPKNYKYWISLIISATLILISSGWAIEAIAGSKAVIREFYFEFWDKKPELVIDKLSAFFILVINFTVLTGFIYAKGYLSPYLKKKSHISLSIHFFSLIWLHSSMIQATMLREGMAFLLVWELMALSSFLLVIFNGENKDVLRTGINYLVQMHLGFGALLVGFLMIKQATGTASFDALPIYFQDHNNFWLFLIFFFGFGIKAGFIPFHSWLPRAHPAAPTHVSAIMSGVIIKVGIYGILRVITHLQSSFLEISILVLVISAISGLMGVTLAIFQHDLKKLLAYHSIENIGIIGIGIGAALLGKYFDNSSLIYLGLGGALLHVLNHSLFKSALFYSAGSVLQATGTKNIEQLGGIFRKMPVTSMLFLISALAICGLPPFNGFISEFLIYNGVFQNLTHAGYANSLASIAIIVSLALIGGLAIFCFTKAFGVTFLGVSRSSFTGPLKERPLSMLIPGGMIVVVILAIGFLPAPFFRIIQSIQGEFAFVEGHISPAVTDYTLSQIGKVNLVFALIVIGLLALRWLHQRSIAVSHGPTWGCGYTAADHKHQYTSTSYADNLRQIIQPFISFKKNYEGFAEEEIFPKPKTFETHGNDKIEEKLIMKPINWLKDQMPKAGLAQTGSINHYLLYPILFMIAVGLLTYFGII
ncbi:MAG: proton-conducting transporter membrane subunit [Cyclobacteriaceae bacterium]